MHHNNRKLCQLGGLEGECANNRYPSFGRCLCVVKEHQHQQKQCPAEQEQRESAQDMIVDLRNNQQCHYPDHCERKLAGDIMEAVSIVVVGVSVARRKKHNQADSQKGQDQNQKDQVHAPPLCRFGLHPFFASGRTSRSCALCILHPHTSFGTAHRRNTDQIANRPPTAVTNENTVTILTSLHPDISK